MKKIFEKAKTLFNSKIFWLQVIGIGVWILVIQNTFGGEEGAKRVYVVGGDIDANVHGYVDANVSGSVDIDNTVSVEVENTVSTYNW